MDCSGLAANDIIRVRHVRIGGEGGGGWFREQTSHVNYLMCKFISDTSYAQVMNTY